MKTMLIGAIIILVVLAGAPLVVLANKADTEKEAGIASDANGIQCTFGPHADECKAQYLDHVAQYLDRIRNSSVYQSGVKNGDYQSGYNHGVADAKAGPYSPSYIHQPGQGFANHTTAFADGYIKGWCSVNGPGSGIDVNDAPEPTIAAFDCDKGLISVTPDPKDWPNQGGPE